LITHMLNPPPPPRPCTRQSASADEFRVFCLQHQYNRNVTYNDDRIRDAAAVLSRVRDFSAAAARYGGQLNEVDEALAAGDSLCDGASALARGRASAKRGAADVELSASLRAAKRAVRDALARDFDTPAVVSCLLSVIRDGNKALAAGARPGIVQVGGCSGWRHRGTWWLSRRGVAAARSRQRPQFSLTPLRTRCYMCVSRVLSYYRAVAVGATDVRRFRDWHPQHAGCV